MYLLGLENEEMGLYMKEKLNFSDTTLTFIDNLLFEDLQSLTNANIKKGGFSLSQGIWKQSGENSYSISTYLQHTHFVYYEVTITIELANNIWQANFTYLEDAEYLRAFFSKPLPVPFSVENIKFLIEYWHTPYTQLTYWRVASKIKVDEDILKQIQLFLYGFAKEWNHIYNQDIEHIEIERIEYKIYEQFVYCLHIDIDNDFNNNENKAMQFILEKLSNSEWGNSIEKLVFEWVF